MRACPSCGELVAESANYCHLCGQRMPVDPPPPQPRQLPVLDDEPRIPRPALWVLALAAIVLLAGVGAVLVLNNPEDQPDTSPFVPGTQATSAPVQPPDPERVLAATGTVRIMVSIARCEGCLVTAIPADGSAELSANVANGTVEFTMDNRSTLGLGFTVSHPQGFGEAGGPNVAVLSPLGASPGSLVSATTIADATSVGICWAGTLDSAASIRLAVEPHGDRTPTGGLRVWADPAQPVLESRVAPSGDGTVEAPALSTCGNEFRLLGG